MRLVLINEPSYDKVVAYMSESIQIRDGFVAYG